MFLVNQLTYCEIGLSVKDLKVASGSSSYISSNKTFRRFLQNGFNWVERRKKIDERMGASSGDDLGDRLGKLV